METHNFSIEFFPPKTPEGVEKLRVTRRKLAELNPTYFSVTFGAGGTTQQGTLDTVLDIMADGDMAAPQLSCIGATRDSTRAILQQFQQEGIRRLVAPRGHLRTGYGREGDVRYANEMGEFNRQETGRWF